MPQSSQNNSLDAEPAVSTIAHVHLDRLARNVREIRKRTDGLELIGVVKANAYGHGAERISRALEELGISILGVATAREGSQLRKAGIRSRIVVFAPPLPNRIGDYEAYELEPIVESSATLDALLSAGISTKCHLKIDTGMGRLGERPSDALHLLQAIERSRSLELDSIWTHFARADEPENKFTSVQLSRFNAFIDSLAGPPAKLHVAASAAIYEHPETIDPSRFSIARVGIALYGLLDLPGQSPPDGLRPIMELTSRVSSVKRVDAGTPISYGSRWVAERETRIAVVSAGYADGFLRNLTGGGFVRIHSRLYPVVGAVCMDMFMIDLGAPLGEDEGSGSGSHCGNGGSSAQSVRVGDEVTLFGEKRPTCFDIARQASTITYVPVCGITDRVPRHYSL